MDALSAERHTVETAYDGEHGQHLLKSSEYELLILDWEMPKMSGLELLRHFRQSGGKSPVIMLTGKRELQDKEQGFEMGADDYLPKPFMMRELILRVRALLRRTPTSQGNTLEAGGVVLDTVKHVVIKDGQQVHLLPRDFSLLEFFMRHPGETFSADALLSRVWHHDSDASQEGLRVAIRRIRKALDSSDDMSLSIIQNIPRVGYRLRA